MKMYSNSLPVGDMLSIGLYSSVLQTDMDVKSLDESVRQCWFKDEVNL